MGVILCSLVDNGKIRSILQISTGILVLLVLLKPIAGLDLEDIGNRIKDSMGEEFQTENYQELYREKLKEQIRTTTEKYIQDKASALGAEIHADITLSNDNYPVPAAVEIRGKMSYEQKQSLENYLTHELGIPPEKQRWNIHD